MTWGESGNLHHLLFLIVLLFFGTGCEPAPDAPPAEELFDTQADPHELNNLADDPTYADKLAELRAENERWVAAMGDTGMMPEPELIERMWPGMEQPATHPPVASQQDGQIT